MQSLPDKVDKFLVAECPWPGARHLLELFLTTSSLQPEVLARASPGLELCMKSMLCSRHLPCKFTPPSQVYRASLATE